MVAQSKSDNLQKLRIVLRIYYYDKVHYPLLKREVLRYPGNNFIVLPVKREYQTLRKSPHGRGKSTYDKYHLKIYKALAIVKDAGTLQKLVQTLNRKGVLIDARIT